MKAKIKIANYLDLKNILFLDVSTREDAISKLVSNLDINAKIDKKVFYKAVITRENIVSTGVGMGVAIPHAKMETIPDFFISIGIQKQEGLNWDAIDKSLVHLIFLIGGPHERKEEYLQILSHLTAIIKNELVRKKIMKSVSQAEILALLKQC